MYFSPSHSSLKSILVFEYQCISVFVYFSCLFFYLIVIVIHTCSIIVTMGTKQALQLCKKKLDEYFYIVDT